MIVSTVLMVSSQALFFNALLAPGKHPILKICKELWRTVAAKRGVTVHSFLALAAAARRSCLRCAGGWHCASAARGCQVVRELRIIEPPAGRRLVTGTCGGCPMAISYSALSPGGFLFSGLAQGCRRCRRLPIR